MKKTFDRNSTLIVFLNDRETGKSSEKRFSKYNVFLPTQMSQSRQTILSAILEYSQSLMRDLKRDFMNIILIDPAGSYSQNYIEEKCAELDRFQFITAGGYAHSGKMGFTYNPGALNTSNMSTDGKTGFVDIPVLSASAFRHCFAGVSKFKNYDNWNKDKYLDLELALFAKEQNDQFHLLTKAEKANLKPDGSASVNKVHKAAIYNELFVKNTFGVKAVHYSGQRHLTSAKQSACSNLELLRSIDAELNGACKKLEYVDSKVGNYEAVKYNIQSSLPGPSVIRKVSSFLNNKCDEHVTFSLASIPERSAFLQKTIHSIYGQCDKIHVYLNGYSEVPEYLNKSKIIVHRSQDNGDLSANGKVWFLRNKPDKGYVFLIDDDIIYPRDYVQKMVAVLEKYQRRFAGCIHGSIFSDSLRWYYQRSSMFPFKRALLHDCLVNLPGSGTFAFHTDTLKLNYDDFQPFTMVDLILGILCKNQKVPIVSIARQADWLKVQKDFSGRDLWSSFKSVMTLHTPTALANGPWDFHSTRSYVLPVMEEVFGILDMQKIEEMCLDKHFLKSAYNETIPELWSFASRLQTATEKNYQNYLYGIFNDEIDKCLDGLFYENETKQALSSIQQLRALDQRISYILVDSNGDQETAEPMSAIPRLLHKLQYNIRTSASKLTQLEKTDKEFMANKRRLSKLKKSLI